jgi:hypothetical protein
MHTCAESRFPVVFFPCCLDLESTYNQRNTMGKPMSRNTAIVRTGILRTKSERPKHNVPSPRIDSQRVAVSIFMHPLSNAFSLVSSLRRNLSVKIRTTETSQVFRPPRQRCTNIETESVKWFLQSS